MSRTAQQNFKEQSFDIYRKWRNHGKLKSDQVACRCIDAFSAYSLQDIANMYYALHPEQLVVIACGFNFRTSACRNIYTPVCLNVDEEGVTVLHGNGFAFHDASYPSYSVWRMWERLPIADGCAETFRHRETNAAQSGGRTGSAGCGEGAAGFGSGKRL